jgi:prevent-host-death family protein
MKRVGMRELKNNLARYLRIVQHGESVVIMSRGKPVARLVPISAASEASLPPGIEERMWDLVASGLLDWPGGPPRLPEAVARNRGPDLLSDLVVEDRE